MLWKFLFAVGLGFADLFGFLTCLCLAIIMLLELSLIVLVDIKMFTRLYYYCLWVSLRGLFALR